MQRMLIEIREEDWEPLRRFAWEEHRAVREHAGYLLHQAIQKILIDEEPPAASSAVTVETAA